MSENFTLINDEIAARNAIYAMLASNSYHQEEKIHSPIAFCCNGY